jgi:hypothetical protein
LLVLRRVRVSLTTHFLFTVLPKLIIQHVLSTAAVCIKIYRAGRRLIGFKLSCNLFGIIPILNSTHGIS